MEYFLTVKTTDMHGAAGMGKASELLARYMNNRPIGGTFGSEKGGYVQLEYRVRDAAAVGTLMAQLANSGEYRFEFRLMAAG